MSAILKLMLYLLVITVGWVLLYRFVDPPFTPLMAIRYVEDSSKDGPISKKWKDYKDISDDLALAVIAAEDQNFLKHNGFDVEAIQQAADKNKKRKKVRGASTISQQVAKNAFLWPSRTWLRKGLEAYFTFLIEIFWSKKRILEVYMNVAEMGEGVYGAEAAAQLYFKKPARSLTRGESALLAAILPDPRKMSPAKPSEYVYERQRWIIQQMSNLSSLKLLTEDK